MKNQKVQKRNFLIGETFEKGVEKLIKKRSNVPDYYYQRNKENQEIDDWVFQQMSQPQNFQKSQRYQNLLQKTIKQKDLRQMSPRLINKESDFILNKKSIIFEHFSINKNYYQKLVITNKANQIRRIKFIKPQTQNFTIKEVKYPTQDKTEIASGQSVIMKIQFNGENRIDYKDVICFITEKDYFYFQLKAICEKPQFEINKEFKIKDCWYGQTSDNKLTIKNIGGDGQFNIYFKEKNQKIFSINKQEFFLQKNQCQEFNVTFNPQKEGTFEEIVVFQSKEGFTQEINLKGICNILNVKLLKIDNEDINKEKTQHKILFDNCQTYGKYSKKIIVKNYNSLPVEIVWNFFNKKHSKNQHNQQKLFDQTIQEQVQQNSQDKQNSLRKQSITKKDLLQYIYKVKSFGLERQNSINFLKKVASFVDDTKPISLDMLNENDKDEIQKTTEININLLKLNSILEENPELMTNTQRIQDQQDFYIDQYNIVLQPYQEQEFEITYNANINPGNYQMYLQQIIKNIPSSALDKNCKKLQLLNQVQNMLIKIKTQIVEKHFTMIPKKVKCTEDIIVKNSFENFFDIQYNGKFYDYLNIEFIDKKPYMNFLITKLEKIKISTIDQNEQVFCQNDFIEVELLQDNLKDFQINEGETWRIYFQISSNQKGLLYEGLRVWLKNSQPQKLKIHVDYKPPIIEVEKNKQQIPILPLQTIYQNYLLIKNNSNVDEIIYITDNELLEQSDYKDIFSNFQEQSQNENCDNSICEDMFLFKQRFYQIKANSELKIDFNISALIDGQHNHRIFIIGSFNGYITQLKYQFEVQKVDLKIQNKKISLESLLVEKKYRNDDFKDDQQIVLQNQNSFSIQWQMQDFELQYKNKIQIKPMNGIIAPQQKCLIKYKFCLIKIKEFTQSIKIDYQPYFGSNKNNKKIYIQEHVQSDEKSSPEKIKYQNIVNIKKQSKGFDMQFQKIQGLDIEFRVQNQTDGKDVDNLLKNLDFIGSIMNPIVKKFYINNKSEISIPYKFEIQNTYFQPIECYFNQINEEQTSQEQQNILTDSSTYQGLNRSLTLSRASTIFDQNSINLKKKPKMKFKNANGQQYQKKQYFKEKCTEIINQNKQQTVIAIQECQGVLKPFKSKEITLIVMGQNHCNYYDKILFKSKKTQNQEFDIQINLKGARFELLEHQVGLQKFGDNDKILKFGELILWQKPVQKYIKIQNKSGQTLQIQACFKQTIGKRQNKAENQKKTQCKSLNMINELKLQKQNKTKEDFLCKNDQQENRFKVKLDLNSSNKINFEIEPQLKESNQNSGFCLEKETILIPPFSIMPLKVIYSPFKKCPVQEETEEVLLQLKEKDNICQYTQTIKLQANRINPKIQFLGEQIFENQKQTYTFYRTPYQKIQKQNNKIISIYNSNSLYNSCQIIEVKNNNKCKIGFVAYLDGPFKFQNSLQKKVYKLDVDQIAKIQIYFTGFDLKDSQNWPKTFKSYKQGFINLNFAEYYKDQLKELIPMQKKQNSLVDFIQQEKTQIKQQERIINLQNYDKICQEINIIEENAILEGIQLRPQLMIVKSLQFKQSQKLGPVIIDFGIVHTLNKKYDRFFILNESQLDAEFKICNKQFQDENFCNNLTLKKEEIENEDKVDDPSVFSFDITSGIIKADQNFVQQIPDCSQKIQKIQNLDFKSQQIRVVFCPRQNYLYKSYYKLYCKYGNVVEFYLKGIGTNDKKFFKENL